MASPIRVAIESTRILCGGIHGVGRLDRIRDHQLLQIRFVDAGDRAARQHAVGDIAIDGLGALLEQRIGGVHQRAAGIDDVVDQDADARRRPRR